MSIKTSKRIALGVIASLVFAPFAAIAPASANAALVDIDAAAITDVKPATRTGVLGELTTAFTHNGTAVATEVYTFKAALVSKPATSTAFPTLTFSTHTDTTNVVAGDFAATVGTVSTPAKLVYTVGTNGDYADNEILTLASSFTPDVVGTYEVVVWFDLDDDNLLDTGETSASKSYAAVAGSDAVTVTLTHYNSTAQIGATGNGSLVRVAITNSAGAATSLGGLETLSASVDLGVVYKVNDATANADAASVTLNRNSFNRSGRTWLNLTAATAGVQVLTVAGNTGAALSGVNLTRSTTFAAAAADISAAITTSNTTGVFVDDTNTYDTNDGTFHVDATKTTSVGFEAAATTGDVIAVTVTDVTGDLTGLANTDYTTYVTAASSKATFSVSFTPSAVDDEFIVYIGTDANNHIHTLAKAATVSAAADSSIEGVATIRAVVGASVTVSAIWKNQFGIAAANQNVATSIVGRNAHVVTQNAVTDANGRVTFTYTDAPLAGVVAVQDTITMNGPTNADETFTVNWVTTLGVSTVTLGGGNNSATGTALATPVINDIKAGAGAETGIQTITATVKDVNGSILVGVPVAWSVSDAGTKANILSTKATTSTNASGEATTSVYAWINGTYTVTAVAGGVTATVTIDFRQTAGGGEERTITAAASGRVVTATVIDRFGNPVPGVTVWALAPAGNSFLGYVGAKRSSTTTDISGKAEFVVGGADATITVTTVDPTVVGAVGSGQTCAAATKISCAATATALAAATTGTATTAETGVGNSLAPAGVATATAAVTGLNPVAPEKVYEKPTLSIVQSGGRIFLSGTAEEGEGDIIIYVKRVGTTAWKERAKTLEVAAPGDFNGSIKAPRGNVVIRVKQEGTGLFSNQVIIVK